MQKGPFILDSSKWQQRRLDQNLPRKKRTRQEFPMNGCELNFGVLILVRHSFFSIIIWENFVFFSFPSDNALASEIIKLFD